MAPAITPGPDGDASGGRKRLFRLGIALFQRGRVKRGPVRAERDELAGLARDQFALDRVARIAAACLCAILRERGFGAGTLTGICADGTMLKLNPVLRPRMEALIAEFTKRHGLGGAEFLFAGDATLLGCAWAALA